MLLVIVEICDVILEVPQRVVRCLTIAVCIGFRLNTS